MRHGPHIARVAAMIGDPARAEILTALMGGQALTATELAGVAEVTKQTASSHLAKLLDARLVGMAAQGRHRYYRLADGDVAQLLEGLMGVAARSGAMRLQPGPKEPMLRHARICYDHLAGDQGVMLFDTMIARRWIEPGEGVLALTRTGHEQLTGFGIDVAGLAAGRRPLCRTCLDWSARRHHLGGAVGAALLGEMVRRGWARRGKETRAVHFTEAGEAALRRQFGSAGPVA